MLTRDCTRVDVAVALVALAVLVAMLASCGGQPETDTRTQPQEASATATGCPPEGWEQDTRTRLTWQVQTGMEAGGSQYLAWCACLADCPAQPPLLARLGAFAKL